MFSRSFGTHTGEGGRGLFANLSGGVKRLLVFPIACGNGNLSRGPATNAGLVCLRIHEMSLRLEGVAIAFATAEFETTRFPDALRTVYASIV